jgi:transcriptional regulator with GAF, ATPase, and Fis domain
MLPPETWAAGEVRHVQRAIAMDRARPGVAETLRTRAASAPVPTTILISGESGTGKNHLARLIHELGPRHDTPFLKIDCLALPSGLAEAELFGYERGGFPGAGERKLGAFELGAKAPS